MKICADISFSSRCKFATSETSVIDLTIKRLPITVIAFFFSILFCMAQNSVTGVVSDRNDIPVQGVTVRIKGTTLTTFSAADGRYAITVSGNESILEYLFDGNIMREVFVSNQREINVRIDIDVRRSTTATAQERQKSNLVEGMLVTKGRTFYLADQKLIDGLEQIGVGAYNINNPLSTGELQNLMTNTTVLQMYNKGVKQNRNGNIWMITGVSFAAVGGIIAAVQPFKQQHEYYVWENNTAFKYYENSDKISSKIGTYLAISGGVMIFTGAIMKSNSIKLFKQTADLYNSEMSKSNVELSFNFTGNGVRFAITF